MILNPTEAIGMVAGTLTTLAFIPQALSVWKSKSAAGVSAPMYCIFLVGICLWFAYGIMTQSLPVVLFNGITFFLALFILAMKLRFG